MQLTCPIDQRFMIFHWCYHVTRIKNYTLESNFEIELKFPSTVNWQIAAGPDTDWIVSAINNIIIKHLFISQLGLKIGQFGHRFGVSTTIYVWNSRSLRRLLIVSHSVTGPCSANLAMCSIFCGKLLAINTGLNSFILNNSSYPFMKDIIVTIKSLQLVFPSISVLSSQNFDQCVILFFGLTEELEKAKMQSYRSVEQLEALSGKYHNKKMVLSRCLIVSFLV